MLSWIDKSIASGLLIVGEVGLLISSIVVVVGIFGEIRKSSLEWASWLHVFEFMVLFGVGGELIFDGVIFVSSHRLQSLEEMELTVLRDRALDAEGKIADANKTAQNAAKKAAELGVSLGNLDQYVKDKTIEFNTAANTLKSDAEILNKAREDALKAANNAKNSLAEVTALISKENALQEQLKKQITDEKRNIEELQKAIDPRRLSDSQKYTITAFLRDKPKGKLTIYAYNGAFDSKWYSDQIAEAVKASGWDVAVEIGGGPFWDNGGSGNYIHYGNAASYDAAKILYPALKASNIAIDEKLNSEPVYQAIPDRVVLFIGTKY